MFSKNYCSMKIHSELKNYCFQKDNVGKWHHEAAEVVSVDHFPAESSPDLTNSERAATSPPENRAMAFTIATAAAAEAALAAAQAAAKVVRLSAYNRRHSKEEKATILIQSYYRGYLVRLSIYSIRLFAL